MDRCELDPNFEPQTRARSNTWPLRPNREVIEAQSSPVSEDSPNENFKEKDPLGLNTKKSGSRRNAWGNLSYADLITKAIQSAPEKRLTLSQIYDWMVQNVPYFKDKGDSTSSAGWKNSIRHNLSLHSRFMRIQNEGTGKSSWWVINPDARSGKTPRRRAGSMETKNYEKKRGRVKKKVEALRAAMENSNSPTSTSDDFLDTGSILQFSEFRQRASSNASSCGRLSPIQAAAEPDLHDNQVPPMSPILWGPEMDNSGNFYSSGDGFTDQLVDTLVDSMKLADSSSISMTGSNGMQMVGGGLQDQYIADTPNGDLDMSDYNQNSNFSQTNNYENQYTNLPAPPPYPDQLQHSTNSQSQQPVLTNLERVPMGRSGFGNLSLSQGVFGQDLFQDGRMSANQLSINTQQQVNSPVRSPQQSSPQTFAGHLSPCQPTTASPNQNGALSPQASRATMSPHPRQLSPGSGQPSPAQPSSPSNQPQPRSILQQQLQASSDSILRAALTQGGLGFRMPTTCSGPHFPQMVAPFSTSQMGSPLATTNNNCNAESLQENRIGMDPNQEGMPLPPTSSFSSGTAPGLGNGNNNVPLDIDVENLVPGWDCDVEDLINKELTLEGNLDFQFDSVGTVMTNSGSQNAVR